MACWVWQLLFASDLRLVSLVFVRRGLFGFVCLLWYLDLLDVAFACVRFGGLDCLIGDLVAGCVLLRSITCLGLV